MYNIKSISDIISEIKNGKKLSVADNLKIQIVTGLTYKPWKDYKSNYWNRLVKKYKNKSFRGQGLHKIVGEYNNDEFELVKKRIKQFLEPIMPKTLYDFDIICDERNNSPDDTILNVDILKHKDEISLKVIIKEDTDVLP